MKKIGVSVACDFMNVEFCRLEELPRVTEVLRDVYEEAVAELLINAPRRWRKCLLSSRRSNKGGAVLLT